MKITQSIFKVVLYQSPNIPKSGDRSRYEQSTDQVLRRYLYFVMTTCAHLIFNTANTPFNLVNQLKWWNIFWKLAENDLDSKMFDWRNDLNHHVKQIIMLVLLPAHRKDWLYLALLQASMHRKTAISTRSMKLMSTSKHSSETTTLKLN